jgi:hypothetical protein
MVSIHFGLNSAAFSLQAANQFDTSKSIACLLRSEYIILQSFNAMLGEMSDAEHG